MFIVKYAPRGLIYSSIGDDLSCRPLKRHLGFLSCSPLWHLLNVWGVWGGGVGRRGGIKGQPGATTCHFQAAGPTTNMLGVLFLICSQLLLAGALGTHRNASTPRHHPPSYMMRLYRSFRPGQTPSDDPAEQDRTKQADTVRSIMAKSKNLFFFSFFLHSGGAGVGGGGTGMSIRGPQGPSGSSGPKPSPAQVVYQGQSFQPVYIFL